MHFSSFSLVLSPASEERSATPPSTPTRTRWAPTERCSSILLPVPPSHTPFTSRVSSCAGNGSPRRPVVPLLHARRVRGWSAALEENQRQSMNMFPWSSTVEWRIWICFHSYFSTASLFPGTSWKFKRDVRPPSDAQAPSYRVQHLPGPHPHFGLLH